MLDIIKKIIILLVVILLGYFAYTIFFGTGVLASDDATVATPVGADILAMVDKLEATNINPKVFSSPLFSSLKDFTATVIPEAVGRTNPFAVPGTDSALVEASMKVATSSKTVKPFGL